MSRGGFIFRIGGVFSDLVFCALIVGGVGKILWHSDASTRDWVGFLSVGGDIAGVMAYFSFLLFGFFYFCLRPRLFWRSGHPINFGLALLLMPSYYVSNVWLVLVLPVVVGGLLCAALARRLARMNARALIALGLLSAVGGWRFAGDYRVYFFGAMGAFLVTASCATAVTTHAIIKRRQERTATAKRRQQNANTTPPPQNRSDFPA